MGAHKSWTPAEDELLMHLHALQTQPEQIALEVGHSYRSVLVRLQLLENKLQGEITAKGGRILRPLPGIMIHRIN